MEHLNNSETIDILPSETIFPKVFECVDFDSAIILISFSILTKVRGWRGGVCELSIRRDLVNVSPINPSTVNQRQLVRQNTIIHTRFTLTLLVLVRSAYIPTAFFSLKQVFLFTTYLAKETGYIGLTRPLPTWCTNF